MTVESWSIQRRLVLAFVGVLGPYLALVSVGVVGLRAVLASVSAIHQEVTVELESTLSLELALGRLDGSVRQLVLAGGPAERAEVASQLASFGDALAGLDPAGFRLPEERRRVEALRTQGATIERLAREIAAGPDPRADPVAAANAEELRRRAASLSLTLHEVQAIALGEIRGERLRVLAAVRRMLGAAVAALVLSVAGGIVLAVLFARWIGGSLAALSGATRAMAAGDLSRRVGARAGGELGEVCRAFNDMAAQVETLRQGLADRVRELEEALAQVKQLQGLLPICSYCKKIRGDRSLWQPIEAYVSEHSEAQFSHGICPDCLVKVRADLQAWRIGER